jgi:site-specific recombinase XerD
MVGGGSFCVWGVLWLLHKKARPVSYHRNGLPNTKYELEYDMSKNTTMTAANAAVDAFLARYTGQTMALYRGDLRILFEWCASEGLDPLRVERTHLEFFARHLEMVRGNKPASVRRRLSTVRTFYGLAAADGRIGRNPALMLRLPKLSQDRARLSGLSHADSEALLQAARVSSPDDYALVALMLLVGLRVSEACAVRVEDTLHYERGHRVLKFTGKGSKQRVSVIAPALALIVDACAAGRTEGLLIHNRYGGPLTRNRAYNRVGMLARRAGLGHVWPHMLRHTAITAAIDAGASLENAQEFSGHVDIRTLMVYYHNSHRLDQSAAYLVAGRLSLAA